MVTTAVVVVADPVSIVAPLVCPVVDWLPVTVVVVGDTGAVGVVGGAVVFGVVLFDVDGVVEEPGELVLPVELFEVLLLLFAFDDVELFAGADGALGWLGVDGAAGADGADGALGALGAVGVLGVDGSVVSANTKTLL